MPRCNLSFLPPSIREVGKEKMSILELNSIGLECKDDISLGVDSFDFFSNNLIIVCLEQNLARDCRFYLFDSKKLII